MAVNVKVGMIGVLDMLKFKNMAKVREQAIQAAPANEITGEFSINKLAKELHPDYQRLVIKEIIDHKAAGAKTFVLGRKDNKPVPYFRAGQYLSLKMELDGARLTRPYSISSAPAKALKGTYEITVKTNPSGFAADKMLKKFKVGDELITSAPEGNFFYENLRDPKHIVALAGGSGVTPFLSMAHAIADKVEDFDLTLFYACKKKSDILFKDEFDAIEKKCKKFRVIYVLEEDVKGFEHGFITADMIAKYAPKEEYSLFISGPEAMMRAMKDVAKKLGLPGRHVRFEMMPVTKKVAEAKGYPKAAAGKSFKLKVHQGEATYDLTASADEPILAAIERAGIKAPSRCRSGECGWCRSKLVKGKFFVPEDNEFRRYSDVEFDYIHPCCTFPTSDMEIEVPGEYWD